MVGAVGDLQQVYATVKTELPDDMDALQTMIKEWYFKPRIVSPMKAILLVQYIGLFQGLLISLALSQQELEAKKAALTQHVLEEPDISELETQVATPEEIAEALGLDSPTVPWLVKSLLGPYWIFF